MPKLPPIPGYAEAVQKEREMRNLSFLSLNENIAGITVKPLTLDHLIILQAVKSPFLTGKEISIPELAIAVSIFLWIVSPQFRPFSDEPEQLKVDKAAHFKFIKSLRKLDFLTAANGIFAYVDDAFFDSPSNAAPSKSYCSWAASLISVVAEKAKWTPEKIRETPLKQLWQYIRAGSSKTLFNPSDRILSDWLGQLNRGEITLEGTPNV